MIKAKTLYKTNLTNSEKALIFNILENCDSDKNLSEFCDALSNALQGNVTKKNLSDMAEICGETINETKLFDKALFGEFDGLLKKVISDCVKQSKLIKS